MPPRRPRHHPRNVPRFVAGEVHVPQRLRRPRRLPLRHDLRRARHPRELPSSVLPGQVRAAADISMYESRAAAPFRLLHDLPAVRVRPRVSRSADHVGLERRRGRGGPRRDVGVVLRHFLVGPQHL